MDGHGEEGALSTVWCPVCANAVEDPAPEWAEDGGVTEEVCSDCERDLYGNDETRAP